MMRGLRQNVCLTLALGCSLSAMVACQSAPTPSDTASTTTAEPVPEESETTEDTQRLSSPSTNTETDNTPSDPPKPETPDTKTSETDTTVAQPNQTASASVPVPPLPPECSNPPDQQSMNLCARATYDRADAELNNAYQAVKTTLATPKVAELQSAEQAWIEFRDLYCDFVQSQFEGGSIQPMVYHGCLTLLTKDRTDELQQADGTSLSYEAADAELNAVYQELQPYLTSAEQTLLTDAQVAWIDYRDLHCEFETNNSNACLASVTETRTNQLREQLDSRSR